MRLLWLALGLVSLGLGIIGAVLPLLPTVPFLLLSAWAFSRSSQRLHDWLLAHPLLGPPILDWRRNRAIRRQVKWLATASIAAAFGLSLLLGVRPVILGIQAIVLSAALLFIWTRPEGPRRPDAAERERRAARRAKRQARRLRS